MISYANIVNVAAAKVKVYEGHVQSVENDIRAKIESGNGANLFLVFSHPGAGATFLLERLTELAPASCVSIPFDTFNYAIEFTGKLADAFGLYTPGEDYRKMPRYLFKAIEASKRTNIFIDDLEMLCNTRDEIKSLRSVIGELQNRCANVNFVIKLKSLRRFSSLAKYPGASVFSLSKYVAEESCMQFVKEYSTELARRLGHVNMPIINLTTCSRSVSDWAATARAAMIIALARGSKTLDMGLEVSESDCDEVRRLLEIIAPR